jgi:hypothetical protein
MAASSMSRGISPPREALHHPDHEGRVQARVDQDQPEARVQETPCRQHDIERDAEHDAREHPDEQNQIERHLADAVVQAKPGQGVGGERAQDEAYRDRGGHHDHAVQKGIAEVVVVEETVVVVEGDLLRPERHTREDVDRTLEGCGDHPPEGEECEQDRRAERQMDRGQAEAFAKGHSIFSEARRISRTAAVIRTIRKASTPISIAMALPY